MRRAACVAIVLATSAVASAQPSPSATPADGAPKPAGHASSNPANEVEQPAIPIFSAPRLGVAPALEPRPVDLFPTTVFGPGSLSLDDHGSKEKEPGVRFGNGGWKTHAVQAGGMMVGWAALAALCGGGRCMLPKGLTSWMPGTTTEAPPAPARVGPRTDGMPKMR